MTDSLEAILIDEPQLEFGFGQKLTYPRDGLFLFGPVQDSSDPPAVRYGVIGTKEGVRRHRDWAEKVAGFIPIPLPGKRSRSVEPQHIPFPGFAEAFSTPWSSKPHHVIDTIDPDDLASTLRIENRHEAVKNAVSMYVDAMIQAHDRLENPPKLWFVVIPEEVYRLGRPKSVIPKSERILGEISISKKRARKLDVEPTLFGIEDLEAKVYKYATHFRRQLKARLLKERIVTQIVRETTLTPSEFVTENGWPMRRIEDPATVAWKLCTGTYYKAGGKPWQLANVRSGVCYVGLVYKHTDPDAKGNYACCAAQMFLTDGDGVVFRGALGPWYSPDRKEFHLDRSSAKSLISKVITEYRHIHDGKPPTELFIHAKSAFAYPEWEGFLSACPDKTNLVGVQIRDAREDLKLYRPGKYPVVRGTALKLTDRNAYLWTSGYSPRLDTYMGPETPNPLQVKVLRGDCEIETVLSDVMSLTKVNFNSCLMNDRLPVTIRFANAVGEVLVAAPRDGEPKLPFKYYI